MIKNEAHEIGVSVRSSAVRYLLLASFLVGGPAWVYAETKELVTDATYTMGDGETPAFAEAMTLQKAKQTALEQAGTYVQSYSKTHNFDLTVEEIQTLAGGVLKVEVIEKKRTLVGDGLLFYVKIKALVTTDEMEELARRIKGRDVAAEYAQLKKDYAQLAQELERWKRSAAISPAGPERDAALDQVRERERSLSALQKNEANLFQRLVSGRVLVTEAANRRAQIDGLIESIKKEGHNISLGQVRATEDSKALGSLVLTVPVTLKASQSLITTLRRWFGRFGGGEVGPEAFFDITYYINKDITKHIARQTEVYHINETPWLYSRPKVQSALSQLDALTMSSFGFIVRVARDRPVESYVLDRIRNLVLVIGLRFTGGGQQSCKTPPIVHRLIPIFLIPALGGNARSDLEKRVPKPEIKEKIIRARREGLHPSSDYRVQSGFPSEDEADNLLFLNSEAVVFLVEVKLPAQEAKDLEQVTARFDDNRDSVKQWCNLLMEGSEP